MKNIERTNSIRLLFNKCTAAASFHSPAGEPSEAANPSILAQTICREHSAIINHLRAIIHHPRSLARPQATWRPPTYMLPAIGKSFPALSATITRYRVGPSVREETRKLGETRNPAYLIYLRLSNPEGQEVPGVHAEAWVRALHPASAITAVHEITNGATRTYVWLVDHHFAPVQSPATLFTDFSAAA